jgi:type II secretory pathway pseudopilin PulG
MPDPPLSPPPKPASKTPMLIIALAVVAVLVYILLGPTGPAFLAQREANRRAQCQSNLQQIRLALLNYESANKCFPPAVFTDDRGKPMKSWRIEILPYCEHSTLYNHYDPKQPWDSPHNRAVANTPLPDLQCPSDPGTGANSTETNYVRIVGKDTTGGMPNEAVKIGDITDGTSNTIMVVEVSGLHIHWAEPRDVTVEEFMEMVAKGHVSFHTGGFQAVFADGSVHFISYGVDPKTLRALVLRNDGQPVGAY